MAKLIQESYVFRETFLEHASSLVVMGAGIYMIK
jgi:hypothetical protein